MIEFILNDKLVIAVSPPTTVLLDFLRREQKLIGTKEGCREGDCGACTVLVGTLSGSIVNYKTVNSCLMPIGDLHGKHLVTIEGLNGSELSKIQIAFVNEGGTQCGFCTPGFIISLTGYFLNSPSPDYNDAVEFLSGNVCRCTGYAGIKRAVDHSVGFLKSELNSGSNYKNILIAKNFIPSYFSSIAGKLKKIKPVKAKVGNNPVLISGGTDLYVQKPDSTVASQAVLLSEIKKITGIKRTGKSISIGAAVTIEEIRASSLLQKSIPGWDKYLNLFGSLPIRNRATIGGNIVNASPIGDMTGILIALNAALHLNDGKKKRKILLKNFYKGYKTLDKKKNEIVESVSFALPSKDARFNYEKVSKRTYLDIASVNSSILIELKKNKIINLDISAGGVAAIPLHLSKMCSFLIDKEINTQTVIDSVSIALNEISPISDVRGSKEYKTLLLRQLLYAHFIKLFPEQIDIERLF